MPHPNRTLWEFKTRAARETKHIEDLKMANPGLPLRHEPIQLGDEKPWPCVWPGCMEPTIDLHCLCAMHELRHIAKTGKPSPTATTIIEWNNHLLERMVWLAHWNERD